MREAPPHNPEAEAAVLGCLLYNPDTTLERVANIGAADFQTPAHRTIYRAIRHLSEKQDTIDTVSVISRLRATGELEEAGGASLVATLADHGTPALLNSYIRDLRDATLRRRLHSLGIEAVEGAHTVVSPADLLEKVESEGSAVREWWASNGGQGFTDSHRLSDWAVEYFASGNEEAFGTRFPFPWPTLQDNTGGWQRGEVITLGGYSGDGKSVAAGQFVQAIAAEGSRIGFWNLEMTPEQIELRLVSMLTGLPTTKLKQPHLLDIEERDRAINAAQKLTELEYGIYSGGGVTTHQIRAEQKRRKYDVVVVDHIHRMPGSERPDTLAQLMRPLKDMALESDCGVIALAQLNRDADRGFPVPNPNRLKGGNVLMEESDYVLFVHRRRDEHEQPMRQGSIVVSKVRDGLSGYQIPVRFEADWMKFVEKGDRGE